MSFFGKFYFASSRQHGFEGEMQDLLRMRGCGCGSGREPTHPPTDVCECEQGYVVRMELAGVSSEDVEVHLSGSVLTVRGCRPDPSIAGRKAFLQMEIDSGPFSRQITLPGPIDAEQAEARLEDGMLEIRVPRAAETRSHKPEGLVRVRWCVLRSTPSPERTP